MVDLSRPQAGLIGYGIETKRMHTRNPETVFLKAVYYWLLLALGLPPARCGMPYAPCAIRTPTTLYTSFVVMAMQFMSGSERPRHGDLEREAFHFHGFKPSPCCATGMFIDISKQGHYVEGVAGGGFTESGTFILQPLEPELGNASGGKRRDSGISSQMVGHWPFGAAFSL